MWQYLPRALGEPLRQRRPGRSKLAVHRREAVDVPPSITLLSPAFADGGHLAQKYTADSRPRACLAPRPAPACAAPTA